MNDKNHPQNSAYEYQCINDGKYIAIWISKCPHCGIDNSKHLSDEGYYERLKAHLRKVDPDDLY
jgi:hypothetical protein